MKTLSSIYMSLHHRLVVSCQAPDEDVFSDSDSIARFARAAIEGGAAGIRANSPAHVRAIRRVTNLPIIGIQKKMESDCETLITASFEAARQLVAAGANIIALDCTARGCHYGAIHRLQRIRTLLKVPTLADIANLEEAVMAAKAGADLIATTMRGYTKETLHISNFDPSFVSALVHKVDVPVIAEGRIATPAEARAAIEAGAFAVIVGTAITRPQEITRTFVQAIESKADPTPQFYLGIDLGGTNTKSGVVASDGRLLKSKIVATPPKAEKEALLHHVEQVAEDCCTLAEQSGVTPTALGIATAGWVHPASGCVIYATDNLPGWTGTSVADALRNATGLPVVMENDANALAVAEKHFGVAKHVDNFVCLTLGTGVGGGCYINGQLNRGSHFLANAIGHINIGREGFTCTCGRKGCLESYANAAALLRYANGAFTRAEDLIEAAGQGNVVARNAIRTYSHYLAVGAAHVIHLLDPEMLILAGGLTEKNPFLLGALKEDLASQVIVWGRRNLQVHISTLGYFGGVLGAAATAATHPQGLGLPATVDHNGFPRESVVVG